MEQMEPINGRDYRNAFNKSWDVTIETLIKCDSCNEMVPMKHIVECGVCDYHYCMERKQCYDTLCVGYFLDPKKIQRLKSCANCDSYEYNFKTICRRYGLNPK